MRFHIGFSKFLSIKTLSKIGIGILIAFGLNGCVAHARTWDSSSINDIKYCAYNTMDPNASCVASSNTIQVQTVNGISDTIVPSGIENSNNGRTVPSAHTVIWQRRSISSGQAGDPCYNPGTVAFNVTINPWDLNNVLAPNELNPNSYQGVTPIYTSILDSVKSMFSRKSYSTSNSYYQYLEFGTKNQTGVIIGQRTSPTSYANATECTFLSYGTNKSLNFRCSLNMNSPSGAIYLQINYGNSSYINNPSLYNNLRLYDSIKITTISDPCDTVPNNNQGVIDSIQSNSSTITQNFNDLIQNNNNNQAQTNDRLDEIIENQEETQSFLSNSSIPNYSFMSSFAVFNLPSNVESLVSLPIDLVQAIINNKDTCVNYRLDFSSITQRWGGTDYVLVIPCMGDKINNLLGNDLYNLVDILLCAMIFYAFVMWLYGIIDSMLQGKTLSRSIYFDTANNQTGGVSYVDSSTGEIIETGRKGK